MAKQLLGESAEQNRQSTEKFDDMFNQPIAEIIQKIKENSKKIALIADDMIEYNSLILTEKYKLGLIEINTITDNNINLIRFLRIKNYIEKATYDKFLNYCQIIKYNTIKVFSSLIDFNYSQDPHSIIEVVSTDNFFKDYSFELLSPKT